MPRKKKDVMGYYMPTTQEMEAYRWCINNGIYISPFANGEGAWYIDINNRSPLVYGPVAIWVQMYEYYKYYYKKYGANKI
jgi:hypothetical protein